MLGYPCKASPDYNKVKEMNDNQVWLEDNQGKKLSSAFERHFTRSETDKDTKELYVMHANVIRYLMCRIL
jgi:hypothetical protein